MMNNNYALANPISIILNKPKEDFTRDDLLIVIQEKRIERITYHYTALDGKLKELKIPISDRKQAQRVLTEGERVDGSSLFKDLVDSGLSDLYVVPVYQTAFLNPFYEGSLDLICRFMTPDGNPASFTPDNILGNAYEYFKNNTNMELYALGELEFYLFHDSESVMYFPQEQQGYHASAPYIKSSKVLDEILRYITQITGSIKYAHSEAGFIKRIESSSEELNEKVGEQFEIEFLPTPIDVAADAIVIAKWLIRNVAYKNDVLATFSPKLEEGIAGNGLHIHLELRRYGKNCMVKENGMLSKDAKNMIGGLCNYADTITAFGNTVASSYLRLVPHQEAPTRVCWSDSNRSVMIRVPRGWTKIRNLANKVNPEDIGEKFEGDKRQTIEMRTPDGSANVHLLLASISLAAEWGITSEDSLKIADDLYVEGNIFNNEKLLQKLPLLPNSCTESSKILNNKRDYYEKHNIFPASIIKYVIEMLQSESDEELHEKLLEMSEEDRLLEIRKVMHQSLHRH
jgi:glutamine synthetase